MKNDSDDLRNALLMLVVAKTAMAIIFVSAILWITLMK
jgi:hypothetical protein